MNRLTILTVLAMVVLGGVGVGVVAAQPGDQVDECKNADEGPSGDAGPPGFVGDVVGGVVGFLGDLFGALPVPNFVKGFFGAQQC